MHLALVTETYAPEINGVAMTLGRLVDGLAARGHQVTIIRPRQRHESPRFSVTHRLACRQIRLPGIPVPGYPQIRIGLPARFRLLEIWRREPPDLVHVATEGPLGASAITAARQLGVPVTSSFHTNFDQYTRNYRLGWLAGLVAAWLRRVHNRTARTFVPTRELAGRLESAGYENVRLLSRGVDVELFSPARRDPGLRQAWGAGPADPVVIHVGRIAAEKNYQLLFRAFDRLRQRTPTARLVLVGDGPMLARHQAQRPDAVFTGFYTGINLARHYASGDIYLHSSVTETFGNVITEAMASGLAVAAFDLAAAHEFIRHGENGLIAAPGNEEAFCSHASELGHEPALRARIGAAARSTAEGLGWTRVIDGFERDLQEVIASRAPAHRAPTPSAALGEAAAP